MINMDLIIDTPFPDMFEKDGASCLKSHYEKCLLQGDVIKIIEGEFSLFTPKEGIIGYLVVTNSCDLAQRSLNTISLVPIYSFDIWFKNHLEKSTENITKILFREANYVKKDTFFISPIEQFENKPSVAYINDIRSIDLDNYDILLKYRLCSLKPPWREKLGHKVANLFNRVSTFTPEEGELKSWIEIYKEQKLK